VRKEIEVLIFTGATTAKVEANNTSIKHIKRTGREFTNARNYKTRILLHSAAKNSGVNIGHGRTFTTNREEPVWNARTEPAGRRSRTGWLQA
jgi:hypothetical protein